MSAVAFALSLYLPPTALIGLSYFCISFALPIPHFSFLFKQCIDPIFFFRATFIVQQQNTKYKKQKLKLLCINKKLFEIRRKCSRNFNKCSGRAQPSTERFRCSHCSRRSCYGCYGCCCCCGGAYVFLNVAINSSFIPFWQRPTPTQTAAS